MAEKAIMFKHFNPIIYEILNIVWIAVLALSAYFLLNNIIFPKAIGILLSLCLFRIVFDVVIGKKLRDLPGKFIYGNGDFNIISFYRNIRLYYSDIAEIKKEWYTKGAAFGSRNNAGQYSIFTKHGAKYIFRISENEENEYSRKIGRLHKKIYKTNSLGVHFNTRKLRERLNSRENEIKFEQEKPVIKYTLETVIEKLLEKSNIGLNDTTIEK